MSIISKLRDLAYDTVFHVGDTALQFTADLIHGPDNYWSGGYHKRQSEKTERKNMKAIQKGGKPAPRLNAGDHKVLDEMLKRQKNETIIEHWKRRKAMLDYPNKRELVEQFKTMTEQKGAYNKRSGDYSKADIEAKKKALEASFQTIQTAKLRQSRGQKQ